MITIRFALGAAFLCRPLQQGTGSFHRALNGLDAGSVAAFLYLEPLVTLGAAMALLGEKLHVGTLAGGALLIAGVSLVQKRRVSPTEPA